MRNYKLVTNDGRVFNNPTEEVIRGIAFGIVWEENITNGTHKVISPFSWTLLRDQGKLALCDPVGECRKGQITWGQTHRAIEFPSWEKFDAHIMNQVNKRMRGEIEVHEEQIENLQSDLSEMMGILCKVYDINKSGGPKSRTKVGNIIFKFVNPCRNCGKADCECDKNENKPSGWLGD